MKRQEIESLIQNFLVQELEVEGDVTNHDALLKEDLGIDSLDMIDVRVLVDKHFGFKIEFAEMTNVKTLGQFYDYVESKISKDA